MSNEKDRPHEASVLDWGVSVARHRKAIIRSVVITLVATTILLFLVLSKWYKSTAVVMPPKQQNPLALLSGVTRSASSLRNLALGGAGDELAKCQTVLMSRRVMDSIISKFSLATVYDLDEQDKVRKELAGNTQIKLGDEDVSIEITVYDTDKQRAADMANYYVRMLDTVYLDMSVGEARANRAFLEQRYRQNLADLASAEESLRVFQKTYGVYSVPEQLKASVEAAAALESQIMVKDLELGMLQGSTTSENPQRQLLEIEVRELKKQQRALQNRPAHMDQRGSILVPFSHAPDIGVEYLRRYRELELQTKLLELFLPLFEQARIEERRNTPSVIVLDTAVPADRHAKPKRLIILAATFVGAFLLACGAAVVIDGMRPGAYPPMSPEEKLAYLRESARWRNVIR